MVVKTELKVQAGSCRYKIKVGEGLLPLVADEMAALPGIDRHAVISDSNVAKIHAPEIMKHFRARGLKAEIFQFPAGERSKTRENKQKLEDMMQSAQFGRDCAVVALGGGVTGDLAGFVAATYCRGVPYVQVPTTLVACVDSAVGGKTGVDTPAGKNLIGAFYQPVAVYADIGLLATLAPEEIVAGLAEVIKYGVIKDAELFEFLEKNISGILKGDKNLLSYIVERSCSIKAGVVEKDEREADFRKILNFGHTVGHAVEKLSDYAVPHGDAVAIGMVAEAEISVNMGLLPERDAARIEKLISAAGLPAAVPEQMKNRLAKAMKMDKKTRAGNVEMSLPRRIGEMAVFNGMHSVAVDV